MLRLTHVIQCSGHPHAEARKQRLLRAGAMRWREEASRQMLDQEEHAKSLACWILVALWGTDRQD